MIPFIGFVPDVDELTPGAILDASQIIPTQKGIQACPSTVTAGPSALPAECRGAALLRNLSGVNRLIAGTSTNLFEAGSTAWGTVSASSAGYSLGTDDRWSFCQFGNSAIAATISEKIQRSTSGNFATITAAPKAQIVESLKGFVLALHTNETTFGDSTDRWFSCAQYDETDWTPSVATQCATGRLVEGGGPITAGRKLGDDLIVYKRRAMFIGRYAGPPSVWDFVQVTTEIGCVGQEAVINIGYAHIFAAEDNIYLFDGVRPQSIADGKVREWFTSNLNPVYNYRTKAFWDKRRNLAWIFFVSTGGSSICDSGLVYHTLTGRWGYVTHDVEAVVSFVVAAITYDGGSPLITTYDSGPSISYDSPFWLAAAENGAVFTDDHVLKTFSGTAEDSSFTTGDMGDEDAYSFCDRLQVRYFDSPDTATATGFVKDDEGVSLQTSSSALRDDNAFDFRQTGRFHRFHVEHTGNWEAGGVRPRFKRGGSR